MFPWKINLYASKALKVVLRIVTTEYSSYYLLRSLGLGQKSLKVSLKRLGGNKTSLAIVVCYLNRKNFVLDTVLRLVMGSNGCLTS